MSIFQQQQQQQQPKATFEVINQNVARFLSTFAKWVFFWPLKIQEEEEDTYSTSTIFASYIRCTFISTPFKVRF